MKPAFEKWYEETMLREFGTAAHQLGRKRDHHLLSVFVKEVITGEKTFDELIRDFGLEPKP